MDYRARLTYLKENLTDEYIIVDGIYLNDISDLCTQYVEIDFAILNQSGDILFIDDALTMRTGCIHGKKYLFYYLKLAEGIARKKMLLKYPSYMDLKMEILINSPNRITSNLVSEREDDIRVLDINSTDTLVERIRLLLKPSVENKERKKNVIEVLCGVIL